MVKGNDRVVGGFSCEVEEKEDDEDRTFVQCLFVKSHIMNAIFVSTAFRMAMNYPAFTLQPQRITALWPVGLLIYRSMEVRRLSCPGVAGYILRWYACPKTVTHPSTNRPIVRRPETEPTTIESQVRRHNH